MKSADDQVKELNKRHFVAQEGGRTRVYNERYDSVMKRDIITSSSFDDFRNLYLNQYVTLELLKDNKVETKSYKLGAYWLGDPQRRQYEEIVFSPGKKEPDDVYNLWRGFSVEANDTGSWSLLQKHLLDNVCSGSQDYYDYLLDWMANTVQHPDQQANVAVVLKGKRGGGKGSAIGYFAELFGQHQIHVFSSRQVTGNFNYHLRDAVVLFSDEAIYAGNRAEESVLKGLITERYIPIEGKHKDLIMVKNCLHVMISTNNQWAVPAGLDERRFFVLNMKDDPEVKQNTRYFNAIKLQMDSGGRGRMLNDLMKRNLSKFDTYKAPGTAGLLEQKIESLEPVQAWWYNKLCEGKIFDTDAIDWEDLVPKEAVYNNFARDARFSGHNRYQASQISFGMQLSSMMPDKLEVNGNRIWPRTYLHKPHDFFIKSKLMDTDVGKKKHYLFPPLAECRVAFERVVGHVVNWPIQLSEVAGQQAVDQRHAKKLDEI